MNDIHVILVRMIQVQTGKIVSTVAVAKSSIFASNGTVKTLCVSSELETEDLISSLDKHKQDLLFFYSRNKAYSVSSHVYNYTSDYVKRNVVDASLLVQTEIVVIKD